MSAPAAGVCRDASRLQIEHAFLIPVATAEDDGSKYIYYTDFTPAEGERDIADDPVRRFR